MGQIIGLNRWYESLPETRRMLVIPAILIVVGGINMALTIASGFPFALLFLIALLVILALRAPYAWGLVRDPAGHATAAADHGLPDLTPHLRLEADWLYDANLRYDALPEPARIMAIPLFLAVVGWINMSLTIGTGFPFGLLFLLGVIAVVAFRLPFEAGWLKQPGAARVSAAPASQAVLREAGLGEAGGRVASPGGFERGGLALHEAPPADPVMRDAAVAPGDAVAGPLPIATVVPHPDAAMPHTEPPQTELPPHAGPPQTEPHEGPPHGA